MNNNFKYRGRVFGCLETGFITIHIAYGYGRINDGGGLRKFRLSDVPKDCQLPNTYVWIYAENGIERIEKMSDADVAIHKME